MRIGELARRTGISARMLRYYEDQSLLCPRRESNGYREYDEEHIARAERIRCFLNAGVPPHALKSLLVHLELTSDERRAVGDLPAESGFAEVGDLRAKLTRERDRLEGRIRALERNREALTDLMSTLVG